MDLSVSSSSWGLGRGSVCDCGTPWSFLLPFFVSVTRKPHFSIFNIIIYNAVIIIVTVYNKQSFCLFCLFMDGDSPLTTAYGVYLSKPSHFARVSIQVSAVIV